MQREIVLFNEKDDVELKCPLCGTNNIFIAKSPLPFLHCSTCKYVFAWKTNNELIIERKE